MLFYTSKDSKGKIEATYNGRFAFIYFNNVEEYERTAKLRNGDGLSNLWEVTPCDDAAKRILRHENTHKQIFAKSKTGLVLNSLRLMTQLRFVLFGSLKGVESYYKMRTAYLMETISYHEQIAADIDAKIGKTAQPLASILQHELEMNQSIIEEAEQRIQKK